MSCAITDALHSLITDTTTDPDTVSPIIGIEDHTASYDVPQVRVTAAAEYHLLLFFIRR